MAYDPQTWTNGVSKLNATRLSYMETGIDEAHDTADAAIPAPASPSDDMALIYDTTTGAWVAARVPEAAFASGKIFAPSKIQQDGASIGQGLVWDGSDWGPENIKPSKLDDESATTGQVLTFDGSIWAPDDLPAQLQKGSATVGIANGASSGTLAVSHGFGGTPTVVLLTFGSDPRITTSAGANGSGVFANVTSVGGTQFTIELRIEGNLASSVGSTKNFTVYWIAA